MDTPKGALFYTFRVSNILPGKAIPRLSVMSNVVVHPKTIVDHASGGASKPKLLDEVRAHIRRLNYSIRTEDAGELGTDHGFLVSAPLWQKTVTGNRGLSPIP